MAYVIRLKDATFRPILDEDDFAYLIEEYMGYEAADYFREILEDAQCSHRDDDYDE